MRDPIFSKNRVSGIRLWNCEGVNCSGIYHPQVSIPQRDFREFRVEEFLENQSVMFVSIPQRDFREFRASRKTVHLIVHQFQSLKGILGNFEKITAMPDGQVSVFQSLKGILGNFEFSVRRAPKIFTRFQSLKGILGNFEVRESQWLA